MIEAVNKVIKHQFLYPTKINNKSLLENIIQDSVDKYNSLKTQFSLSGNTP